MVSLSNENDAVRLLPQARWPTDIGALSPTKNKHVAEQTVLESV